VKKSSTGVSAPGVPGLLWSWIHLVVLWAFGVAQPLLSVLSDSPEFFVARGNTAADIVVLALGLVLAPPTLLFVLELPFVRVLRVRSLVHVLLVALLITLIALQLIVDVVGDGPGIVLTLAALAIGAGAAWLYGRSRGVSSVLSVLAPVPLVFLFLFLVISPVSKLVFEDEAAEAAARVTADTPVVMLVLDEFSGASLMDGTDHVDKERFPHFAALAATSTWYRNAVTAADHTTISVPAMLSGTAPRRDALPIASDYPGSLFTLLGRHYSFANVDEPSTNLCPQQLCSEQLGADMPHRLYRLVDDLTVVSLPGLLPDDLADGLPPVDRTFGGFRNDGRDDPASSSGSATGSGSIPPEAFENRALRFAHFVNGIRPSRRPGLHFLHVQLPHTAYQYLPSGQQYSTGGPETPGLDGAGNWADDPLLPLQADQRYLLQIGYVDRLVGDMMRRLREEGMYDDALVMVTADHGISFRPGQSRRSVEGAGGAEIASVPMFIKAPGQRRGRVDDGRATTLDLLSTIADLLGVEIPWRTAGTSLRARRPEGAITVVSYPSGAATMSFDEFVERRDVAVDASAAAFGRGWRRVFRPLGSAGVLGKEAASLSSTRRSDWRVELDDPLAFEKVDPRGSTVPALVSGRISGGGPERALVVSVNGRLQALTRSYGEEGQRKFGALVPPSAFRRGANSVQVYELQNEGGTVSLAALRGDSGLAGSRLSVADEGETISGSGGRSISIDDDAAAGFVDSVRSDEGRLVVSGWATDAEHRRPADRILVFAGDRLVTEGDVSESRGDVARQFGSPAIKKAGFELSTVAAASDDVRVFAVVGDRASELDR
jgi:hypothetical protein